MLLVLESWSQLGKSSRATGQEAAQPRGRACARCVDQGRAPTRGCFPARLVAGCGGWRLRSLKGPRHPRLGQVSDSLSGRGEEPPAGTSPFQDLHAIPAPAAAFPGLGAIPGAAAIPLAKEKHRAARGAPSMGEWAKKVNYALVKSHPVSQGRCPCFHAVQEWEAGWMKLEEQQQWGQAGRAL